MARGSGLNGRLQLCRVLIVAAFLSLIHIFRPIHSPQSLGAQPAPACTPTRTRPTALHPAASPH